ncbi:MAG: thioredoxin [Proteobacteria bacterium]|nr:thioredoxin [Pseudomonadota bacterium]
MASDKVQTVTDSNFDTTIKTATVPVLVDFWAEWCQPCLRLGPSVDALAAEFDGKLIVAKMNVDENPQPPAKYGVRGIPNLKLFKGGQVVDEIVGAVPRQKLEEVLKKVL